MERLKTAAKMARLFLLTVSYETVLIDCRFSFHYETAFSIANKSENLFAIENLKEASPRAAHPPGLAFNLPDKKRCLDSGAFPHRHSLGFVRKVSGQEKRGCRFSSPLCSDAKKVQIDFSSYSSLSTFQFLLHFSKLGIRATCLVFRNQN